MIVKVLPALSGDALLLSWVGSSGQNCNLLMDGGVTKTYTLSLKHEIQTLIKKGEYINLLILSHIDSDHIGGILRLVNEIQENRLPDQLIARCWFNSARVISRYFNDLDWPGKDLILPHIDNRISIRQGNTFENFLTRLNIPTNSLPVLASQQYEVDGLVIDILSPDETGLRKLSKNWPADIITPGHVPLSGAPTDYHR
ncbi:MAG: MBL fold metallo-hydrolase, partial [Bacteroidetes bacterium]|nr:MBL fold metallo-hydrolase [Bacteroidota bacterium]